ncbi:MAG: hypothetical protein ACRD1V_07240 [Vicinamibacterales bacterium]
MKRLFTSCALVLPLVIITAIPVGADVKTRDRASVKFEGMLGRMFSLFGGKSAKEGVETSTAVKGNRKATINENTGKIIDLSEEKVYDLDMKKKTYTVTTFDQLRQKMKEDEEKAQQEAAKEQPAQPQQQAEPQKPQNQYEVDFDVKDTGQKKQVAGYDTHEAIVTITVRQKGQTLEDGGGIVLTDDMWLGPDIPQLKEVAEFDMRYWQQLEGSGDEALTPEQMATVMAMYPGVKDAMARLQKGGGNKLQGTPLDQTMTFDSVKSQAELAQEQQNNGSSGGAPGGLGGMLAKRMMKNRQQPQARATIFTTHHEVLELSPSATAADVAIPPDFREKK